jgi:acyl-CoA thioesterase
MQPSRFEFDAATALSRLADADASTGRSRFAGEILPGWDIGGNANGGYVLAVAARAMQETSGRRDPITVTAHYLAPTVAGPVDVSIEVVKAGKRLSTMTGSMVQQGREVLRVLASFGDLSAADDGPALHANGAPPDLPSFSACPARAALNGDVDVAIADRLELGLHPDDAGFQGGQKSDRGVMRGYFGFADGRPVDTLALLLAADAFPPAVFNLDVPRGWVPTIELTVQVRAVPAPGLLRCSFETRFVQGGYLDEEGELWDSTGRLVAQSRQLALLARA